MTPAQTQPGAEMDAQVARMMGWTDVQPGEHGYVGTSPHGPKHSRTGFIPHYSTHMGCAWLVVEHMRKLGWLLELIDGGNEFAASFRRVPRFPGRHFHASAPAAICVAAIAALAATGGEG